MNLHCPHCRADRASVVRDGRYFRASDSRTIQRYRCKACELKFSSATFSACYRQKKRRSNLPIRNHLVDGCSQRRIAQRLGISRTTVARKLIFLAEQARQRQKKRLSNQARTQGLVPDVQFDELITFEHTRLKPLSVPVMVDCATRQILAFEVARIPASGRLAEISRRKYGKRDDESVFLRNVLFRSTASILSPCVHISTDQHTHYRALVRRYYPQATHKTHKSIRSSVVGLGELKSTARDPLFRINHTLAMLRDNTKRLARRTWCTTKKPERLADAIAIYVDYLNWEYLPAQKAM